MELNITLDQLIKEQLEYADIEEEPSVEEGWALFALTCEKLPKKVRKENLRARFNKLVEKGEMEKKMWQGDVYYRITPQEETR